MNEHLIGQVQEARFTPTRLREGYDMGQVDYFLDQVCVALGNGESVEEMIASARFTPVKLREGYDMGEVQELLERVRSAAAGGPAPESEPEPQPESEPESERPREPDLATPETPQAPPTPQPGAPQRESAITAVEPGVVRLVRRLFRSRQS